MSSRERLKAIKEWHEKLTLKQQVRYVQGRCPFCGASAGYDKSIIAHVQRAHPLVWEATK